MCQHLLRAVKAEAHWLDGEGLLPTHRDEAPPNAGACAAPASSSPGIYANMDKTANRPYVEQNGVRVFGILDRSGASPS
eukprot:9770520-Alexandrium_andersonii.AAC.1